MILFTLTGSLLIAQGTHSPMVGAQMPIPNPNNESIIVEVANHVIDNINAEKPMNTSTKPFVLIEVLEATRRVVAGFLYHLTLAAGQGRCPSRRRRKYDYVQYGIRREKCRLLRRGEMRIYKAEVLHAPHEVQQIRVLGKDLVYSFNYSSY
ncbi:hypothetical protein M513_13968, partial [Trichuris suis]